MVTYDGINNIAPPATGSLVGSGCRPVVADPVKVGFIVVVIVMDEIQDECVIIAEGFGSTGIVSCAFTPSSADGTPLGVADLVTEDGNGTFPRTFSAIDGDSDRTS